METKLNNHESKNNQEHKNNNGKSKDSSLKKFLFVSDESLSGDLAYQIKKENEAYFGYLHFLANTDKIKNISDDLKLNQKVLRFLIITPPITKMMRMATPRIIKKTFQPRAVERMEIKKPSPAPTATLSNEALEKKLEEILK